MMIIGRDTDMETGKRTLSTAPSLLVLCVAIITMIGIIPALGQDVRSVPAELLREIKAPGSANEFLRPQQVFVDRQFGEVYVVDTGNNRTVVFDTSGIFKFQFSGRDQFGSPTDLVVGPSGFIYVVGSRRGMGSSIFKFDYDGTYVGPLDIRSATDQSPINCSRLAIDSRERLYILPTSGDRIIIAAPSGEYLGEFPILTDLTAKEREEAVLGSPRIVDDLLYLPASMFGTVYVYDLQGEFIRTIGSRGNDVGELNFPCAVDVVDHQIVVVLDKHRYNVLCFSLEGVFLGEFGGMGYEPGWFYHPEYLAVDELGRIYISQMFLNRVQTCNLPAFILDKATPLRQSHYQKSTQPWLLEAAKEEVHLENSLTQINSRSFFSE